MSKWKDEQIIKSRQEHYHAIYLDNQKYVNRHTPKSSQEIFPEALGDLSYKIYLELKTDLEQNKHIYSGYVKGQLLNLYINLWRDLKCFLKYESIKSFDSFYKSPTQWESYPFLGGFNLQGAILDFGLTDIIFEKVDLRGADFSGGHFNYSKFKNCDLRQCTFNKESNFHKSEFHQSNLSGINLNTGGGVFPEVWFKECNLEEALYSTLSIEYEESIGSPYFHNCHGVYLDSDTNKHLTYGANKIFVRFLTKNNLTPKLIEGQADPIGFLANLFVDNNEDIPRKLHPLIMWLVHYNVRVDIAHLAETMSKQFNVAKPYMLTLDIFDKSENENENETKPKAHHAHSSEKQFDRIKKQVNAGNTPKNVIKALTKYCLWKENKPHKNKSSRLIEAQTMLKEQEELGFEPKNKI